MQKNGVVMTNEINELIKKQAVTESELKRCQNDLNNLGTKVDATNDKADKIKNDLLIYKAFSVVISGVVVVIAWIVSNLENIKGIFK